LDLIISQQHARPYLPLLRYPLDIWTNGEPKNIERLRKGYRAHNAHIRETVPKERLLEYHASHGWEPLCAFLGKDVPDEAMPKVNEGMWIAEVHGWLLYRDISMGLAVWARRLGPFAGLAVVAWIYGRYLSSS